MLEFLFVVGLAAVAVVRIAMIRRAALRRARLRAEGMLDELAATACAALAGGAEPSTSRRCARAVDRYERTRDSVARARTRRELEVLVARHRLRQRAGEAAANGLRRMRGVLDPWIVARR